MLLDELEQTIRLSVSRLRHLLFELRPPVLDSEGLSAALALYIDKIAQESEGRYTRQDELVVQPDEQTRVILYRIAQEAITNVRKHAGPANVTVLLRERDGGYLVQIADDGVGFASGDQTSLQGHLGLAAMRERATLAGGWVRVESAPGEGTTVQAWVPSRQTDEDSSANSTTG
jgi:signal transduction histidine kinase